MVSPEAFDVTYTEWVYQETAGGTLDFIIQAQSNTDSTDIMERVTTGSMTGTGTVTTDVWLQQRSAVYRWHDHWEFALHR